MELKNTGWWWWPRVMMVATGKRWWWWLTRIDGRDPRNENDGDENKPWRKGESINRQVYSLFTQSQGSQSYSHIFLGNLPMRWSEALSAKGTDRGSDISLHLGRCLYCWHTSQCQAGYFCFFVSIGNLRLTTLYNQICERGKHIAPPWPEVRVVLYHAKEVPFQSQVLPLKFDMIMSMHPRHSISSAWNVIFWHWHLTG